MNDIPHERLAAGDLAGALQGLQQQVRASPGDARLRVFLFQLLCVTGQWKRALDQLKVCGELDAGTLAMVNTYTAAVQCEAVRDAVFAGRTLPHVFGPPASWVAQLAQALQLDAQGEAGAAAAARAEAFDAAPAGAGTALCGAPTDETRDAPDGAAEAAAPQPFNWLADADSRLGPVLEVIVNGRYGWLPLMHCAALTVEPVEDLRDLVWAPAHLTFVNGADTVALLPVRYAGTPLDRDGALALSRRTEWLEMAPGQYRGIGQRMYTTDQTEFGLLDLRQLQLAAS